MLQLTCIIYNIIITNAGYIAHSYLLMIINCTDNYKLENKKAKGIHNRQMAVSSLQNCLTMYNTNLPRLQDLEWEKGNPYCEQLYNLEYHRF